MAPRDSQTPLPIAAVGGSGGDCYETHEKRKRDAWLDRGMYASAKEKQRALPGAGWLPSRVHQLDARPSTVAVVDHADPVGALAQWSRESLVVPAGTSLSRVSRWRWQTSRLIGCGSHGTRMRAP